MAKLSPTSPLNGYDQTLGDMRLRELTELDLTALAIPQNGMTKLKTAIKSAIGLSMPNAMKSTVNSNARLLMTQPDQLFAITIRRNSKISIGQAVGDTAYVTDQTDAWVVLELSGKSARAALERICQIDLHPDTFKKNQMARTTLEHMGAIVIRTDKDTFLLMSASSSAKSFLHAVEQSAVHAN